MHCQSSISHRDQKDQIHLLNNKNIGDKLEKEANKRKDESEKDKVFDVVQSMCHYSSSSTKTKKATGKKKKRISKR